MLEIDALEASYDGIKALKGVTLSVEAGEIIAVIGPNGAGKSTLLNCISGVVPKRSGKVWLDSKEVTGMPAYAVARTGLLQVPEGREILADLTVSENLRLGEMARGKRTCPFDLRSVLRLFPKLEERLSQRAGTLSGGEQQMLAIGRALMGGPKVLLLDEPSLGLSPLMTSHVFSALRELNTNGLSILLVEQNANRALEITQRAYVLDQGLIVYQGDSSALACDEQVKAHYLGQDRSFAA
jgi:branched-chain amino acid transport system ATP-binding protein